MPFRTLLALLTALLLLSTALPAAAQEGDSEKKATVELVVPRTTVRPGETLDIGVKFTMQPGWHIYWTNPGDSGDPPIFSWNLPGGGAARMLRGGEWEASEPQFPTPISWNDPGGLVGFGYTGEVIFPATLTVPNSTTPGQEAEVTLAVNYLICKDVCLPEQATATVALSVSPDVPEADDAAQQALEAAKAALPESTSAQVEEEGDTVTLMLDVPSGARNVGFFPEPPDGLVVEDVEVTSQGSEASVRMKLRKMAGATVNARNFPAVVGYDTQQGRRGASVEVPVPESLKN